jgi:GNAT superfamily N-acetyltransferase
MVTIEEVRSNADLKRFVAFPETIYRGHPRYVPKFVSDELNTLRRDRNPAFDYCQARYWMAFRDGAPAGRIAAIVNQRYIEAWRKRRVRFGWIDFVDDPDVSAGLLGAVEQWARELGMEGVHGPLGFCDLDREGMLIEGFDELDLMITIYNHPYYPAHLERLGYAKDVDWVEYEFKVPDAIPETVSRIARVSLERSKLRVAPIRRKRDIRPYIAGVFRLINDGYRDLYSVVALSDRQIDYYTKSFIALLRHEYVKIVLDGNGEVAAFGVALPSLSKALQSCRGRLLPFGFIAVLRALRRNDRLDLLLTAVRPDLQNKGVNAVLIDEMWKSAIPAGLKLVETGPELEANTKVQQQWKHFERRLHRRRRCFYKAL